MRLDRARAMELGLTLPQAAAQTRLTEQIQAVADRRSPRAVTGELGRALRSIVGIWIGYMALNTLRSVVLGMPNFVGLLERRIVATMVGILLTLIVYHALRIVRDASLEWKAAVAAVVCLPVAIAFAATNYAIFYVISPLHSVLDEMHEEHVKTAHDMAMNMIGDGIFSWYFLFAAWAAFYVATSYAAQLRAADRRSATLAREAQEAQLRALRYQINPHFLFNTLNSLSSLILREKTEVAERMIINLSRFFRASLSADPASDLTLEEEIALQRLYLDIEQVRFPDRLKVAIAVDEAARDARVPALILQPIMENAIKYGVARSREPVTVALSAHADAGRLTLTVSDDAGGGAAAGTVDGEGVGLRNVCDRLAARWGEAASCHYGPADGHGFTVSLSMPIERHG
ncbi:MAG: histidine kinase [Sphingomonadaceae bacterium]|nr:histidine kinase [Sphingomonadaceae bacterium]